MIALAAETVTASAMDIKVHQGESLDRFLAQAPPCLLTPPSPAASLLWLPILRESLGHKVFALEAIEHGEQAGVVPLALVRSPVFGRHLVSLPYVNSSGCTAATTQAQNALIDRAVELATEHDVRYLELRQEQQLIHPLLTHASSTKVLMRLELPSCPDRLLASFKSKLRSQIRSGEKHSFEVVWGSQELLSDFYRVFSRNMRDLGTPVFPRGLFASILHHFKDSAELCVVRLAGKPVAAALLMHGQSATEVPSASSLREVNSRNANMVMYWNLLKRAVERGQQVFDFGRSTIDSNTYRFKSQWGAEPCPSIWQYHLRHGSIGDLRPDNAKFRLAIRTWQRLPLFVANVLGPMIVRGIP